MVGWLVDDEGGHARITAHVAAAWPWPLDAAHDPRGGREQRIKSRGVPLFHRCWLRLGWQPRTEQLVRHGAGGCRGTAMTERSILLLELLRPFIVSNEGPLRLHRLNYFG